ncbi:hypothetical protein Tco_0528085 [Tanacetum coccineum]
METQKPFLKDEDGEEVDVHMYRSMIGSLMYLTSSRLDIMFAVCACARYQVNPKVSHLHAVKRIFRYLKGQPKLGLWYPKDSPFYWVAYTDSDYAGASLDRKSTTGEAEYVAASSCCRQVLWIQDQLLDYGFVQVFVNQQLEGMPAHKRIYIAPSHTKKIFGNMRRVGKGYSGRETPLFQTMMVQAQAKLGEGLTNPTDPHHTPTIIQPSTSQPKKKQRSRRSKRKDTKVPHPSGPTTNVADEAVNKEMDDSLVRAATTASSLEAEQDSGNINKTRSKATLNEPSSLGTSSGSGPRRQETMGDTIAQTRFENVSKLSNDLLLARGNTLQSGEDRLKLNELMEFYTKLQQRVLHPENRKTAQAQEITSLKLRVKKLEKKGGSINHKLKRLYKGRKIDDIDKDAEITLVDETQGRYGDDLMFDTGVLDDEEVFSEQDMAEKEINVAEKDVSTADPVTNTGEGVTTASVEISTTSPNKGKDFMEEPEKPTKRKDQIRHDEEVAQRLQAQLQAELEEEDRIVRQREEEANIVS